MAFNADLQVLTQPGGTGNQTYSLASNFDPKAVILWATPQTTDATIASYSFGVGLGTYRGSVVQQRYACMRGLDAAASADTARGANSDALFCLLTDSAGSAARNLEIDLVSMQGGATSEVVLSWFNLHSTASIRVFMLVLGGSDITDALVDDFAFGTGSATQDETVVAGFGKPELLFTIFNGATAFGDVASHACLAFGFGKQGEAGRGFGYGQVDGNTASLTGMHQRSDRFLNCLDTLSVHLARLDTTVANWPTDGFRVIHDATPTTAHRVSYLALRTTASITTGANTALTAGSTQDNAAGFVPKLGMVFGWNLVASAAQETTAADQCAFSLGAYDGTNEACAGFIEDDAATTMVSDMHQSSAKVIKNFTPNTINPVLTSEADASFSGNNFRLTWNDLDTVARQYQWLAIGDHAGSAFFTTPSGTITPAGVLARSTLKSFAGGLTPSAVIARLTSKALSGTITPSGVVRKAISKTFAGSLTPSGVLTNSLLYFISLAGSIAPAGSLVRSTAKTLAGAITPSGSFSQAGSQFFRSLAGAITPSGALSNLKARFMVFEGTITPAGNMVRLTSKALAGSIIPSGTLVRAKTAVRAFAGTLTPSGVVRKAISKNFGGSISPSGVYSRGGLVTLRTFGGILYLSGKLYKALNGNPLEPSLVDHTQGADTLTDHVAASVTIADHSAASLTLADHSAVTDSLLIDHDDGSLSLTDHPGAGN